MLGVTDPAPPPAYPTRFFIWNLAMACIPVSFAAGFVAARRRVWLIPLGSGWLAFLPNAPYLVTDLVHLGSVTGLWRHVMQSGIAAWAGVILGAVSMRLVHQRSEREFGSVTGWFAIVVSVDLYAIGCRDRPLPASELLGFGDVTRRGGRFDAQSGAFVVVFVQPIGVALAVGAFFGLAYLTLWSLWPSSGQACG